MLYLSGLRLVSIWRSFYIISLLSFYCNLISVVDDDGRLYSSGLSTDRVKRCQYALKDNATLKESFAKATDLTETGTIASLSLWQSLSLS